MERTDFIRTQYVSLREEIKHTKARIFKIVSYGLIGVPTAHFLAQSYQLDTVILSLPLLVIVVALLYVSENHALMRCGSYILAYIEPEINNFVGWEEWLHSPDLPEVRSVDRFVSYCIYLLYFVYYVGSVFVAHRFALSMYGLTAASLLLGCYAAVGVSFLFFLIKNIRTTTTTHVRKTKSVAQ